MSFNPSDVGIKNGNFFGFPYKENEAEIIIYSVCWDLTTSYKDGTSNAPNAILEASTQLDFYDFYHKNAWETKIATNPIDLSLKELNDKSRPFAKKVIEALENGEDIENQFNNLKKVNDASSEMIVKTREDISKLLQKNKKVLLLGGDHSTPLGYLEALAKDNDKFGILHFDAHADLRDAYEGFEFSHASIMFNALKIKQISDIVQVGIRDVSADEIALSEKYKDKMHLFSDHKISKIKFCGGSWEHICEQIIEKLPNKVYVSFDIDVLEPSLCPNTGTPVAGGLLFNEAVFLLEKLKKSGKKIIGADLVEVGTADNNDWDANVGARILWKLALLLSENK